MKNGGLTAGLSEDFFCSQNVLSLSIKSINQSSDLKTKTSFELKFGPKINWTSGLIFLTLILTRTVNLVFFVCSIVATKKAKKR